MPPSKQDVAIYGGPRTKSVAAALSDIYEGIAQYHYWHTSALNDLRARYRRTRIGEFWISVNLIVFVLSIGFFYGVLLRVNMTAYVPYLLVGYTFWLLLSTAIVDGCQAFIAHAAILRQRRTPLTLLVLRTVDRAFMTLIHNLIVVVIALAVFRIFPKPSWLIELPALMLWGLNAMWVAFVFGIMCARFRDVFAAIVSLLQLLFLISPILWRIEDVPHELQIVSLWNPISYFMIIVRNPLLGEEITTSTWLVVIAITVIGWVLALALLRSYRAQIVYWV